MGECREGFEEFATVVVVPCIERGGFCFEAYAIVFLLVSDEKVDLFETFIFYFIYKYIYRIYIYI